MSNHSAILPTLCIAPAQVIRGQGVLTTVGNAIAHLGQRPLLVGGDRTLAMVYPLLQPAIQAHQLHATQASYQPDCSEATLETLRQRVQTHQADVIIGIGGGKALDTSKLLAHQCG